MIPLMSALTRQSVMNTIAQRPHAILLQAPDGTGGSEIAAYIAGSLLPPGAALQEPQLITIGPEADKRSIGIDTIRIVTRSLQLRTTGTHPTRRMIIIEHAELLTTEAQNSLLKTLEEPPADTVVILVCQDEKRLLSTIRSRVQTLNVLSLNQDEAREAFPAPDEQTFRRAYLQTGGAALHLQEALSDEVHKDLQRAMSLAKEWLSLGKFERLVMIDSLSKDKHVLHEVLDALMRISRAGLRQAAVQHAKSQIDRWIRIADATVQADEQIRQNASPKLVLSTLALEM